jgi:hypothetical protein
MKESNSQDALDWTAAVYFDETVVHCDIATAWEILVDYEAWNPTFVGAQVTRIEGTPRSEGERVRIHKTYSDPLGDAVPEFYAETVKIVPGRRIVWYCYAREGHTYQNQKDPFRNFVDFGLTELPSGGVRFAIFYYAQNRLSGESLSREREFMRSTLLGSVTAFRDYCERHCSGS